MHRLYRWMFAFASKSCTTIHCLERTHSGPFVYFYHFNHGIYAKYYYLQTSPPCFMRFETCSTMTENYFKKKVKHFFPLQTYFTYCMGNRDPISYQMQKPLMLTSVNTALHMKSNLWDRYNACRAVSCSLPVCFFLLWILSVLYRLIITFQGFVCNRAYFLLKLLILGRFASC